MGAAIGNGAVWIFDAATGKRVGSDLSVPFSSPAVSVSASRPTARRSSSPAATARWPCSTSSGARSWLVPPKARPIPGCTSMSADRLPRSRRTAPGSQSRSMDPTTTRQSSKSRPGKVLQTLHPARRFSNWDATKNGPFEVAFSPDGQEVAIGSAAYDGQPAEIEVFSVADGTSLRRLPVPGVPFIGEPLAWSPDGRVLAGGVRNRVVRIDATTGALLEDLALPDLVAADWSCNTTRTESSAVGGGALSSPGKAWVFDRDRPADSQLRTIRRTPTCTRLGDQAGSLVLPNVAHRGDPARRSGHRPTRQARASPGRPGSARGSRSHPTDMAALEASSLAVGRHDRALGRRQPGLPIGEPIRGRLIFSSDRDLDERQRPPWPRTPNTTA